MEHGAALLGAAERVRNSIGIPQPATSRAACEPVMATIRCALGDNRSRSAWPAGRSMSLEDAITEA